ncbi:glycerate kinase [Mollicutes bacterium LVI A0078]|nr:glycerate kinase [Mollicutes bacterium LVI A0075]WOO91419.1 glycerate kinase [Mollicutes bacterium LVI A0078]
MIDELEAGVIHFNKILDDHFNTNSNQIIGGGADGGLGTALNLFLNATLKPGFEIVENLLNLEQEIKSADLVITGEGRMDSQSINGKGPIGVAKLANKYNKPCIAICGSLGQDIEITYEHGITAAYSTMLTAQNLESAIADKKTNLQITARAIAKTININI